MTNFVVDLIVLNIWWWLSQLSVFTYARKLVLFALLSVTRFLSNKEVTKMHSATNKYKYPSTISFNGTHILWQNQLVFKQHLVYVDFLGR